MMRVGIQADHHRVRQEFGDRAGGAAGLEDLVIEAGMMIQRKPADGFRGTEDGVEIVGAAEQAHAQAAEHGGQGMKTVAAPGIGHGAQGGTASLVIDPERELVAAFSFDLALDSTASTPVRRAPLTDLIIDVVDG